MKLYLHSPNTLSRPRCSVKEKEKRRDNFAFYLTLLGSIKGEEFVDI
jgi:hypothetical protein